MTDEMKNTDAIEVDQHTDDTSDVVYDEDTGTAAIQKLRTRIKQLEKEKQEYLDGWQRMKADVVNRDKAAAEERARVGDIVKEKILEDLLPVLDAFDAAFAGAAWDKIDINWKKGIEYIHSQLKKTLYDNGINSFGTAGEMFDPLRHDIVREDESSAIKTNHIITVLRAGYELTGGRIIRPAQVVVSKDTSSQN